MRITTKIIAGYSLLIGIMTALVTYQAISARRMQSTVNTLSSTDFRGARLSIELLRDGELIEEYARKSLALGDLDYAKQVKEFARAFNHVLKELRPALRSEEAMRRLDAVAPLWAECERDLTRNLEGPEKSWPHSLPPELEKKLAQLQQAIQSLYQSILNGIDREVEFSSWTSRRMEHVALYAAGLALLLSSVISYVIVRSITKPLRQLTAGTRAVAEGKFGSHLDTSSNDEFSELSRDFNSMMQRLGELDTLKKDFVSHVSHELKSPLASMQDNIRLLLDQIPGPLTEKQMRLLGLNLQSAKRLSGMIFNLLDISRIEAGAMKYEMEIRDVSELIRTAVSEIEPKAQEQRQSIQVKIPAPIMMECDANRIVQVLGNLLDNAIKFSPFSSTIEVSAELAPEIRTEIPFFMLAGGQEYLMITVADRGPGIPRELREKIFTKFHQTGQTVKMAGQGVGLGLAIVRTIVDAHKGAIWVEDNPGGGSRFAVLLPTRGNSRHARSAPI